MNQSIGTPTLWAVFGVVVGTLMVLDLGVLNRRGRSERMLPAALFTAFVVALAGAFGVYLYALFGHEVALQFFTGYVVEEALSVDNLFVFLLIFNYFKISRALQHRVLFWGIFGALVMRAGFILAGTALLHYFHWIFYVFGVVLIVSGLKMVFAGEGDTHPEDNVVVQLYKKLVRTTDGPRGGKFFVRENGKLYATPLLLVLVVVEISDIVFAVDSIPAIFAVTTDPFLVYTSNVFAILGLRSLYFLLAGMMTQLHYLNLGLGLVLAFVGFKMLIADWYPLSTSLSLGVIGGLLAASIGASLVYKSRHNA